MTRDVSTVLYHILRHSIPKLGAMDFDMESQVEALQIKNGEIISIFLMRAIQIETILEDYGATIEPNRLTKKIIYLLRDYKNVVSFLSDYIREFAQSRYLHPNEEFEQKPATTIMITLQENSLSLEARLSTSCTIIKQPASNHTRNFDRRSFQRGSDRRFNRPVVAALADEAEYTSELEHHEEATQSWKRVVEPCIQMILGQSKTIYLVCYWTIKQVSIQGCKEKISVAFLSKGTK